MKQGMPRAQLLAISALATVFAAAPASAAEQTREQYVAEAEPICKESTVAYSHVLSGVRGEVKRDELDRAGEKFSRAATGFKATVARLEELTQPPQDSIRLQRWLKYLNLEGQYLGRMATALTAGNKYRAEYYSVKLSSNYPRANNAILEFPFRYCRIAPSRFM